MFRVSVEARKSVRLYSRVLKITQGLYHQQYSMGLDVEVSQGLVLGFVRLQVESSTGLFPRSRVGNL